MDLAKMDLTQLDMHTMQAVLAAVAQMGGVGGVPPVPMDDSGLGAGASSGPGLDDGLDDGGDDATKGPWTAEASALWMHVLARSWAS